MDMNHPGIYNPLVVPAASSILLADAEARGLSPGRQAPLSLVAYKESLRALLSRDQARH